MQGADTEGSSFFFVRRGGGVTKKSSALCVVMRVVSGVVFAFACLLAYTVFVSSMPPPPIQCGVYRNELNSTMTVQHINHADAAFYGYYDSEVGNASGRYDMSGHMTPSGAVVWSVAWVNRANGDSKSATTWCGYRFTSTKTTLFTTWMLADVGPTKRWNLWSTGRDVFKLVRPAAC